MKIYVATSFKNAPEALEVMAYLKAIGHEITHDWTKESLEGIPEEKHIEHLYLCGAKDFEGVKYADVLVLINHQDCRDAMTEFGIALGMQKPIVILYPERRASVFFACGNIFHATGIPHLLNQITRLDDPGRFR